MFAKATSAFCALTVMLTSSLLCTPTLDAEQSKALKAPKATIDSELAKSIRRYAIYERANRGLGSLLNLLFVEEFRTQLELSKAQHQLVTAVLTALNQSVESEAKTIRAFPQTQRDAQIQKSQKDLKSLTEEAKRKILEALTPKQRLRLIGSSLQYHGPEALVVEEIAKQLELTDKQRTMIMLILEAAATDVEELEQNTESHIRLIVEIRTRNKERRRQILQELSANQQARLDELKKASLLLSYEDMRNPPTLVLKYRYPADSK